MQIFFSYCNSNPVLLSDHEGHFALSGLVGTLAFIALIYVVAYATFAAGVVATSVLTRLLELVCQEHQLLPLLYYVY